MPKCVRLLSVAAALPTAVRTSAQAEQIVAGAGGGFVPRAGVIEAMSGIRERRVAADDEQCSDLAVAASRNALATAGVKPADVDLLVFAAAGQDLLEPATAHIVQAKLGTHCQVFDVKNACNSFLNGLQLAEALIMSGACRTALVTAGEINSRIASWSAANLTEFKQNFPGYTMGDAGAAAVLQAADIGKGIFLRRFFSHSQHWELTTVAYGGSMNPRNHEHGYLRANVRQLKSVFENMALPSLRQVMSDAQVSFLDFKRIFVHQVSLPYLYDTLEVAGIERAHVEVTVDYLGNMAAASIPVAIALAMERGDVGPGDRILCIGLASGISFGVMMIEL